MPCRISYVLTGTAPADSWTHANGLRAVVLRWISSVDPSFADSLHASRGMKPYSIEPLTQLSDTEVRLSISCLTDDVARRICAGAASQDGEVRLVNRDERLRLKGGREVTVDSDTSWKQLLESRPPESRAWRFQLKTPTCHKAGQQSRLLTVPCPERYFSSWFHRWNNFSPYPLDDRVLTEIERHAELPRLSGTYEDVWLEDDKALRRYRGFTGMLVISLETAPEDVLQRAHTLAMFSEYAGTGIQTMRGMGVTRPSPVA